MKSSLMRAIVRLLPSDCFLADQLARPVPEALERDSREDQHAPDDLESAERLREEKEREDDREERLHVREERRPGRADAIDRGEPEDVREKERADDGVAEPEPHLPPERELLLAQLVDARERE